MEEIFDKINQTNFISPCLSIDSKPGDKIWRVGMTPIINPPGSQTPGVSLVSNKTEVLHFSETWYFPNFIKVLVSLYDVLVLSTFTWLQLFTITSLSLLLRFSNSESDHKIIKRKYGFIIHWDDGHGLCRTVNWSIFQFGIVQVISSHITLRLSQIHIKM